MPSKMEKTFANVWVNKRNVLSAVRAQFYDIKSVLVKFISNRNEKGNSVKLLLYHMSLDID